jgi:putative spermidine/putrescine transport system substrate-binding protein
VERDREQVRGGEVMPPARRWTKALLVLTIGAALVAAGCGGDDDDDSDVAATNGSLTYAAFGGITQENVNQVFLEPFAQETGAQITNDTVDYGRLGSMVEADNVEWDVVNVDGWFGVQACEDGLAEPLSQEVLDAIEEAGLPEEHYGECHVEPWSYSWVMAWNDEELETAPQSWPDFYDPEQFPGDRVLWAFDQVGIMESAALAGGADPDALYPLDEDLAFTELDQIQGDIQLTESLEDQLQRIVTGRVSMGIVTGNRAQAAVDAGEPVAFTWDQQVLTGDAFIVPRGAPNADLAMDYVVSLLNTDRLLEFAQVNNYGPNGETGREALEELPDAVCQRINTCPIHLPDAVTLSTDWWAENREEFDRTWREWLGA